jgi:hypothetical protein
MIAAQRLGTAQSPPPNLLQSGISKLELENP